MLMQIGWAVVEHWANQSKPDLSSWKKCVTGVTPRKTEQSQRAYLPPPSDPHPSIHPLEQIMSLGADSDRMNTADASESETARCMVEDAAAAAIRNNDNDNSNSNNNHNNSSSNNQSGQIPGGEEHATAVSASSLSSVAPSMAGIPTPLNAATAVATTAVLVEEEEEDAAAAAQQPKQTPYEKAIAHATAIQSTLTTLLSQKSQLESSTMDEWSEKISNYESQSLRDMNDELQQLQKFHAHERMVLEEKIRMENEMEEQKLQKRMDEVKETMDKKRRDNKKRCRGGDIMAMGSSIEGKGKNGGEEEVADQTTVDNTNHQKDNDKDKAVVDDNDDGREDNGNKIISRSAEKEKELEVCFVQR